MKNTLEETINAIRESRRHGYFPDELFERNLSNKERSRLLEAKNKFRKEKPFKVKRTIHTEEEGEYSLKVKYLIKNLNRPSDVVLFGSDTYKNQRLINQFSFPLPLSDTSSLRSFPTSQLDSFFKSGLVYQNSIINQRSSFYEFLNMKRQVLDEENLSINLDKGEVVSNSEVYFLNGDIYLTFHIPLRNDKFHRVFEPVTVKNISLTDKITGEEGSDLIIEDYDSKKASLIQKTKDLAREMDGFLKINYSN